MSELRSRVDAAKAMENGIRELAEAGVSVKGLPPGGEAHPRVTSTPDVDESPIRADLDVPVHVAWGRVMADVQWIAKADRTEQGTRYNYRGIDRVIDAVAPAVRKHGVIVMPVKVRPEYTVINTTKGSAMNYCRAVVSFAIIGPKGDVLSAPNDAGVMVPLLGESIGEGFDSGDKSSMKAQSVALREFYIKALSIPVSRPTMDPEYGEQHELAGPRRPTVAEYAAMILDESTTVARLSQIMQEVDADRSLGPVEVELADGEKIALSRLVRRVGLARKNQEG